MKKIKKILVVGGVAICVLQGKVHAFGLSETEIEKLSLIHLNEVVVDRYTGLFAGGHDVVAYFMDNELAMGQKAIQVTIGQVTFQFKNSANRDAFILSPQIYIPQFGGFCAMQMTRGRKVEASPKIWAIFRDRLFFFHSKALRDEWLEAPGGYAATAQENWKS